MDGKVRVVVGIGEAYRKALKFRNKKVSELAKETGLPASLFYRCGSSDMIGAKVVRALDAIGYRVAFVPKEAQLPDGCIVLPGTSKWLQQEAEKKKAAEESSKKSTGYVQYIGQ